jgi:outer membrane receptor protein involved in Fe transport
VSLLGFALAAAPIAAQQPGAIDGRVVDSARRPLENVVVRVADQPRLFGVTDSDGRYRIVGLQPGTYVLRASRIGTAPALDTVAVGDGRTTVDFVLMPAPTTMVPVTVTATREARSRSDASVTVDALDGGDVRTARAAHPSQILKRIPGVYVSQLSGEGHSTAIRQPITTKPMYLFLEDGIPTRPTGFFNHNALYEVNIPQSGGIEVVKGPGTALYGSDAIGGVVNVLTRGAPATPTVEANFEGGGYGYARMLASAGMLRGTSGVRADLNITRMDGWRENSPYERQSATLRWDRQFGAWAAKSVLTGTHVEQNDVLTLTQDQFDERNPINRSPLAYRRVQALRWSTALERDRGLSLWSVTPFARYNVLELLPSWQLTFDPQTWDTRNRSLGVLVKYRRELPDWNARVIAGADVDVSPGSFQAGRAVLQAAGTGGDRVFNSFTPGAVQYDYDVTYRQASPYVHAEWSPTARLNIDAGGRFDAVGYRYETHLAPTDTGAHRIPASTTRNYTRLSPKLGFTFDIAQGLNAFASYRAGFRAPSQGQLFQQNNAANTVDLAPVKAVSLETGVRGPLGRRAVFQVSVYDMTLEDDIITLVTSTGSRIATNAGETSHRGVEASLGVAITPTLRADVAGAVSTQEYVRWVPQEARPASGTAPATPEIRYDGKSIEAAPSQLANALLTWSPRVLRGGRLAAEWSHTGKYWMDPENTREYGGFDLIHLHANAVISPTMEVFMRVLNVTDRNYAELAAYAPFQGVQMTPGTPRSLYAGVRLGWQGGR